MHASGQDPKSGDAHTRMSPSALKPLALELLELCTDDADGSTMHLSTDSLLPVLKKHLIPRPAAEAVHGARTAARRLSSFLVLIFF